MYDISLIESSKSIIPQLWQKNDLLNALYILREMKLLAKVSEIDSVRQFTTAFSLEEFAALDESLSPTNIG